MLRVQSGLGSFSQVEGCRVFQNLDQHVSSFESISKEPLALANAFHGSYALSDTFCIVIAGECLALQMRHIDASCRFLSGHIVGVILPRPS